MRILLLGKSDLVSQRLAMMFAGNADVTAVETAADTQTALEKMRFLPPGIVVMHASLPDEKAIRDLALLKMQYPAACLIVTGSERAEAYRRRWLDAGADYFFDLPTQLDDLMNMVRKTPPAAASKTAA